MTEWRVGLGCLVSFSWSVGIYVLDSGLDAESPCSCIINGIIGFNDEKTRLIELMANPFVTRNSRNTLPSDDVYSSKSRLPIASIR